MRVAVTVDNGQVFPHFGQTRWFQLYETGGKRILRDYAVPALGEGHEALADCLRDYRVNVLICGAIGGAALLRLSELGILVFGGVAGSAEEAVTALLNGSLREAVPAKCSGHCSEDCGEACGENDCPSCQINN